MWDEFVRPILLDRLVPDLRGIFLDLQGLKVGSPHPILATKYYLNKQKDDINKKNVNRKLHAALLSISAALFEKSITEH